MSVTSVGESYEQQCRGEQGFPGKISNRFSLLHASLESLRSSYCKMNLVGDGTKASKLYKANGFPGRGATNLRIINGNDGRAPVIHRGAEYEVMSPCIAATSDQDSQHSLPTCTYSLVRSLSEDTISAQTTRLHIEEESDKEEEDTIDISDMPSFALIYDNLAINGTAADNSLANLETPPPSRGNSFGSKDNIPDAALAAYPLNSANNNIYFSL